MGSAHWSIRVALFFLPLLLAACGGSSLPRFTVDAPTPGSEKSSTPESQMRKPAVVQKRGGAYYKDDGPGDDIPAHLDDIPDAQPRIEPLHRFANRPYIVLGKSYIPGTSLKPLRQRGIASWYGKKFHGQKTSIGEPYDMFSMTAAHPTLAIPSYVRVTSVSNGKSVIVRVTDRGPFHSDRIIDLSYAAAHRLGYINNGSAMVEIETIIPDTLFPQNHTQAGLPSSTLKPASAKAERDEIEILASGLSENEAQATYASTQATTPIASAQIAAARTDVFLQLGAFSNLDNAENLRLHLSRELDWLTESIQLKTSGGIYRVRLGPYGNYAEAEKVAEKIRLALGYKPVLVTR